MCVAVAFASRVAHVCGGAVQIAYPEFCELFGMLADFVYRYEERPGMPQTLLFRIQVCVRLFACVCPRLPVSAHVSPT